MSEPVDTPELDVQNTDTDTDVNIDISNDTSVDNSVIGSIVEEDSVQEGEVTKELLDSLSDEDFIKFVDEGKLLPKNTEDKVLKPIDKTEVNSSKEPTGTKDINISKEVKNEINYESIYKEIFKPFKANGKEITPRSIEDVIQLMQMGANYTKKMQSIAPLKKASESLSKADIGEEDLNFLIDVHKGDKEAIKKLLSKHKVDPLELDLEATNYVPNNNIVSDDDIEYSNILDDINDSLPRIQEIITKTWDTKSKEAVLKDPSLIRALHEEISMGRFDKVQAQLDIEKTFGKYKGKSDIEAYIDLVTKIATKEQQSNNQINTSVLPKVETPTKSIPDKTKAAPIRNKATNHGSTLTPKDIFSMSEEQFAKLSIRDLIV